MLFFKFIFGFSIIALLYPRLVCFVILVSIPKPVRLVFFVCYRLSFDAGVARCSCILNSGFSLSRTEVGFSLFSRTPQMHLLLDRSLRSPFG
jgi:hypothetical protein